ncbi:hypothetical protein F4604DRAFT_1679620 [Suillus subluteus]|nr:hypothetical protein F4604DRAFT_1679620 [Suillus subluteus]
MYSSHLLSEAVNVKTPFLSTLEAIISNEYGSSSDVLDIDDECDPIIRRMQISLNGLHEILAEALDMFSNPNGSGDGNLTNNDDIGELHQNAIQRRRKNRHDVLNKALYEAQWTSRTVWRIIRLAHALWIEAHTVIEECECDAWDDNDSKGERVICYGSYQFVSEDTSGSRGGFNRFIGLLKLQHWVDVRTGKQWRTLVVYPEIDIPTIVKLKRIFYIYEVCERENNLPYFFFPFNTHIVSPSDAYGIQFLDAERLLVMVGLGYIEVYDIKDLCQAPTWLAMFDTTHQVVQSMHQQTHFLPRFIVISPRAFDAHMTPLFMDSDPVAWEMWGPTNCHSFVLDKHHHLFAVGGMRFVWSALISNTQGTSIQLHVADFNPSAVACGIGRVIYDPVMTNAFIHDPVIYLSSICGGYDERLLLFTSNETDMVDLQSEVTFYSLLNSKITPKNVMDTSELKPSKLCMKDNSKDMFPADSFRNSGFQITMMDILCKLI